MWTFEIAVMLSMIAVNGVFAGYEIALASVSLARLRILDQEHHLGARAAVHMKENISGSLAVIQIGITLFGAVAAATGGAGAGEKLAPFFAERWGVAPAGARLLSVALVVIPFTAASIVFGELIPKVFALQNQEWLCLKLSPIMRRFSSLVHPIVVVFEAIVNGFVNFTQRRFRPSQKKPSSSEPAELRELFDIARLARASSLIGGREESIIRGATGLSRRPVREILLPVAYINTIHADDSLADCLIAAHLYMHTRYPVTEKKGDPQSIIGYVSFKDIVALMRLSPRQLSLRAILHPMPSLPADTPIATALEKMMRDHTHIALISDGLVQVAGMITLEDILEELIGEIRDEHDRLPFYVVRAGAGWVVGGGIPLTRLKEETGIDLSRSVNDGAVSTLSGWVNGRLGRPARGGDIIESVGVRIVVRKIRHGNMQEGQITRIEPSSVSQGP